MKHKWLERDIVKSWKKRPLLPLFGSMFCVYIIEKKLGLKQISRIYWSLLERFQVVEDDRLNKFWFSLENSASFPK